MEVVNGNLKDFGFVIIGVFLAAWVLSYLIYRFTDLDKVEVQVAALHLHREAIDG